MRPLQAMTAAGAGAGAEAGAGAQEEGARPARTRPKGHHWLAKALEEGHRRRPGRSSSSGSA